MQNPHPYNNNCPSSKVHPPYKQQQQEQVEIIHRPYYSLKLRCSILSIALCFLACRPLATANSDALSLSSTFYRRKQAATTRSSTRMPGVMAMKRVYRRNVLGRPLMKNSTDTEIGDFSGAIPTRFNSIDIALDDEFVVIPDKHYGKKIPTNEISPLIAKSGANKLVALALRARGGSDDAHTHASTTNSEGIIKTEQAGNISNLFSALACVAKWVGESTERCWAVLFFAIVIEILATTMLKIGSDQSSLPYTVMALSMYNVSLLSFAACLKKIDVSIAYAIWSALGTALVSVAGFTMFGEEVNTVKVVSLALIMIGVVGLNLSD